MTVWEADGIASDAHPLLPRCASLVYRGLTSGTAVGGYGQRSR